MTMRLTFRPYCRRDGTFMIYINNDRKVSVGVSPEKGYGPTTKLTGGQRKLIDTAKAVFDAKALPFTGSIAAHDGDKAECGPYTLLLTDTGTIGGVPIGEDCAYVVRDGRMLRCGTWFDEPQQSAGDDE